MTESKQEQVVAKGKYIDSGSFRGSKFITIYCPRAQMWPANYIYFSLLCSLLFMNIFGNIHFPATGRTVTVRIEWTFDDALCWNCTFNNKMLIAAHNSVDNCIYMCAFGLAKDSGNWRWNNKAKKYVAESPFICHDHSIVVLPGHIDWGEYCIFIGL